MSNQILYIVASLPRTGTTSLCKMADLCGLKSIHVLKNDNLYNYIHAGYNFFADTPFYIPEFLIGILESFANLKFKFIYSHRDTDSLKASLEKLKRKWNPLNKPIDTKIRLLDNISYSSLEDSNYIDNHFTKIQYIANIYNIDLLNYSFKDGWLSFCDFTGTTTPNFPIPHLNQNP